MFVPIISRTFSNYRSGFVVSVRILVVVSAISDLRADKTQYPKLAYSQLPLWEIQRLCSVFAQAANPVCLFSSGASLEMNAIYGILQAFSVAIGEVDVRSNPSADWDVSFPTPGLPV
ncbi:hypothetical protein ES702_03055 [subsurface metagenome]